MRESDARARRVRYAYARHELRENSLSSTYFFFLVFFLCVRRKEITTSTDTVQYCRALPGVRRDGPMRVRLHASFRMITTNYERAGR